MTDSFMWSYEGAPCAAIQLPRLPGSVYQLQHEHHGKPFSPGSVRDMIRQLLEGLSCEVSTLRDRVLTAVTVLHDHDIVHSDIKPENILLENFSSEWNDESFLRGSVRLLVWSRSPR